MIPLRDSVRPRNKPYINWLIIAINLYVFVREIMLPPEQLNQLFFYLGVIPSNVMYLLFNGSVTDPYMLTFITAMFLHGGWMHVLSNMLFLWVFGDNVEDRLGHLRYLLFYLGTGILASLAHIMASPTSEVPIVGASGAIAGVLGGYFVSFPRARILALVPIIFFFTLMEIPAVVFLALWFILQLFNGAASLGGAVNTVAWWAHIGGFVAGVIFMKIIAPKRISRYGR